MLNGLYCKNAKLLSFHLLLDLLLQTTIFHTVINFFSAENIWTQLSVDGEFPGSLQEHTMVGYRDTLYVFGGEVGFSNGVETPLWMYSISVRDRVEWLDTFKAVIFEIERPRLKIPNYFDQALTF